MFTSARLKLTAWYLLIIMSVSFFFSMVIYRGLVAEVERISRFERFQVQSGPFEYKVFRPAFLDPDFVDEVKKRIVVSLVVINGVILFVSGGLGYFLAGKTLEPIAEMVEEQNRFISDASHELRTPLTSLRTAIEVGMRDKAMDLDAAKKLINENLAEINKLQSLSEGLLQLAQYRSNQNSLEMEKISIKKVADETVRKMEPIARDKNVSVVNSVKDFKVFGNQYSLNDLLVILVDNAIKYSKPKGKVEITAKKNKKTVTLSVADNGIGIDEKDLPHVFDRFYRAETARSRKGAGGYGLGLSIARKIVDAHKGTIALESKPGKGTTVKISLPVFS
ncbi:MAG: sensor histidine kinase [Patescibacteria group bacterium]